MNALSEKAGEGKSTAQEQNELNAYEQIGHLLALL